MLRTASPHDREVTRQPIVVPWPPAIKPPTLRAVPMPRRQVRRRVSGFGALRAPWSLWFWLAAYVVFNTGDLVTTDIGLRSGLHEGNPLMRSLLSQHGFIALVAYKLVVVVAVVVGLSALHRRHPRMAAVTLAICNVLVGLAVLLNIVQYATL
jgi:hypothetical protein